MKRKKIVSVFLCFILSCGLVVGTVRYIAFQTILNQSWYDEIRSNIYFIDRVKDALNQELIHLTKMSDISLKPTWKLIQQKDIKEYFDTQLTLFIHHMENPGDDQIMNLTDFSQERMNQMIDSSLILPKQLQQLTEEELTELEALKGDLLSCMSPYLMEDDNKDGIVDFTTQIFLFLSPFTNEIALLIIVSLVVFSLIALMVYHSLNKLNVWGLFSVTSFMTGGILIFFNQINRLPYIKPSSATLYDEFSLAGAVDISKKTLFFGKQLIALSLITSLILLVFKEYRRINTFNKKDT